MNVESIKLKAQALFNEAHFLHHIENDDEYSQALALMDELIDDYDENEALISMLAKAIDDWEQVSPEFSEFNKRISELSTGVAVLKTLMEQYQLKAEDLKEEIGSKSLVSMILNGSRSLTVKHIKALSNRFNLSPAFFLGS